MPSFIVDGSVVPLQIMTHDEALVLMNTPAWSEDIDDLESQNEIDEDVNNKTNNSLKQCIQIFLRFFIFLAVILLHSLWW